MFLKIRIFETRISETNSNDKNRNVQNEEYSFRTFEHLDFQYCFEYSRFALRMFI